MLIPPLAIVACDAVAYTPGCGHPFTLGSYLATSPRLAMRWLRARACDIADQLDPAGSGPVRGWLRDPAAHEHALAALARGEPYSFTVHDVGVRFHLTALPVDRSGSP